MILLELYVPRGTFSAGQLRELAGRLTMRQLLTHADAIGDVAGADEAASANLGVLDFVDSVNHVVVHEISTWVAGGRALDHAGPPRYLVRVCVPGPWRKAMSPFLVATITRAIAQASSEPGRCYREPCAEVYVIGVPEGGYGIFGQVAGESALLEMISQAKTDAPAPGDPGALIDPVCGMAASDTVPTLEHEGTTYGFCSPGCRRHFAEKLTKSAAQRSRAG
jgi:YHS domain-containing protein